MSSQLRVPAVSGETSVVVGGLRVPRGRVLSVGRAPGVRHCEQLVRLAAVVRVQSVLLVREAGRPVAVPGGWQGRGVAGRGGRRPIPGGGQGFVPPRGYMDPTARGQQSLLGSTAWTVLDRGVPGPGVRRVGGGQVQGVEGQQPRPDRQQVVPPGQQAVHAVLEAHVLLLELVEGGEQGGDVEVAGLLHEEAAALLPVPLQQLLHGPRLPGRVQHAGDGVGGGPGRAFPPPTRERDPRQLDRVHVVDRVRGNLVLKVIKFKTCNFWC